MISKCKQLKDRRLNLGVITYNGLKLVDKLHIYEVS